MTSGIAFGLLVMCRPTFWPVAGLCGLYWVFTARGPEGGRRSWQPRDIWKAVSSILGAAIIVLPWVVRNEVVFGVPILTTTHGGYTLILGNNPLFYADVVQRPWGTLWPEARQRAWDLELKGQMQAEFGADPTEVQADRWLSQHARSYIASHPGPFLESVVHRIRSLWNRTPQGDTAGSVNPKIVTFVGWYYSFLLTFALIGACLVLRSSERVNWRPLFALVITVQCVHLFYWTNTRMRAPLTSTLALFVAAVVKRPQSTDTIAARQEK